MALAAGPASGQRPVDQVCHVHVHCHTKQGKHVQISNSWRTTGDIAPTWESILRCLDNTVGLSRFAGPGAWNDPDLLEVSASHSMPLQSSCMLPLAAVPLPLAHLPGGSSMQDVLRRSSSCGEARLPHAQTKIVCADRVGASRPAQLCPALQLPLMHVQMLGRLAMESSPCRSSAATLPCGLCSRHRSWSAQTCARSSSSR